MDAGEGASLSTTSFGTIGLSVGLPLLAYGFCAYFSFLPGADISALMLIYGFSDFTHRLCAQMPPSWNR